jgi:serine phosphatase RsbU (regulator of sigma subunit)
MTGTNHQHAGDGMDIGLWSYSAHDRQLQFAGANINAHLYRKGEWTTLKATRRPIGLRDQIPASQFALHQIHIEPGDRLYTWSDGFPDMMGGQKGKKLKTSGAMELLQRIAEYPIDQQATAIRQFIDAWKGDHELVDDITIVGVAF